MDDIQRLTLLAASANSPHIRRMAPFIQPALEATTNAGIQWEAKKRYVILNNGTHRGRYSHPKRVPRRRGGIVIHKMRGNRLGRIVRTIHTFADLIEFVNNPTRGIIE